MSTERFFSAPKDDHAGEAVTEDALEVGAGDKAWEREQGTQCLGGLHPWRLPHRVTILAQLRAPPQARNAMPGAGHLAVSSDEGPLESALTPINRRRSADDRLRARRGERRPTC